MTKILNPQLEALWAREQSIKMLSEIVENENQQKPMTGLRPLKF